jgi:hypothetical protein
MSTTSSPLQAQTPGSDTAPKVLLIVREEIKTGKMAAHSGEANTTVNIWAKAKSPHHRLAMMPVAGNENEVLYLWPFDSFAELEKSYNDLDKIGTTMKADFDRIANPGEDYHSSQRDSIAVYLPELSYNPTARMPDMRFMRWQVLRVKPGKDDEFEESQRLLKAAHEKAKIDESMYLYRMAGGGMSGVYLRLIPWKSLEGMGTIPHGKAYWDAMGDDNRKKIDPLENDALLSDEVLVYAFAPQLSYLSAEFVAANPAFWTLKQMNTPVQQTVAQKKAAPRAKN